MKNVPLDVPEEIGPYTLVERLGEGGFGAVWRARQSAPFKRDVALKLLKPGMDSRAVLARFDSERQALARMDHPAIARVYDGGATRDGRPYFAMELVEGVAITSFCDERRLDLEARLRLFVQVCRAVEHAHQKGVIHRDLKPSNVLVALVDGRPHAKVIDFGVAKALREPLTEQTLVTSAFQMIGTLEYMSPEQSGMADVDTRADVYSLGVLAYEILSGSRPFDVADIARGGFERLLRHIREIDPPKPSARVDESSVATAERRAVTPRSLHRALDGDLDWIVMRALEKDRERRYPTASALADDVERFLAHEPVHASPPSRVYRLRKLVRRNRVAVLAGASVVVALGGGLGAALRSLDKERRALADAQVAEDAARDAALVAEKQRDRSDQITRLLLEILSGAGPSVARGRDATILRDLLAGASQRMGLELAGQPDLEGEMRLVLGDVYHDLSDYPDALREVRRAIELFEGLQPEQRANLAQARGRLGQLLVVTGDPSGAVEALEGALATLTELTNGEDDGSVAAAQTSLGMALSRAGRPAEACAELALALEMIARMGGAVSFESFNATFNLGAAQRELGELAKSEASLLRALDMARELALEDHPQFALVQGALAHLAMTAGDDALAVERLTIAIEHARRSLGDDHLETATMLHNLAMALENLERFAEADAALRESVAIQRAQGGIATSLAHSLKLWTTVLRKLGRLDEAESVGRDALTEAREAFGGPDGLWADLLHELAVIDSEQKDFAGAETLARESLAMWIEISGPDGNDAFYVERFLGRVLWVRKDLAGAEEHLSRALEIRTQLFGEGDEYARALAGDLAQIHAEMQAR